LSAQTKASFSARPAYAWWVVFLLLIAYVVSFIDRQILALLIEPIKRDLDLSDTSISLLHGFAFAVFYSTVGIPIGRLADYRSRRGIIAAGIFFWSLMTAACGLARNFWHLLIARFGVGVGEASLLPSAYSLIADYFPPEKRGRAISLLALGPFVGAGLAYILGGAVISLATATPETNLPLLGPVAPWRLTFFLVGIPGILLALLMLTVREPRRREMAVLPGGSETGQAISIIETVRFIRQRAGGYSMIFLSFALISMLSFAYFAWIPSFFIRSFGWSIPEVGLRFGLVVLIFGPLGTLSGGYLADVLLSRGFTDAYIRTGMIAALTMTVSSIFAVLMPSASGALVMLAVAMFFHGMPVGLAPTALQAVTPNQMRGQVNALFNLVVNVVGFGLGPIAVALVTDFVLGNPASLKYSLAIVSIVVGPMALLVLRYSIRPYMGMSSQ
jgi:MFS family permease